MPRTSQGRVLAVLAGTGALAVVAVGLHFRSDAPALPSERTGTTSVARAKRTLTPAEKRRKRLEDNGEIARIGPAGGNTPSTIMWPQTNGWGVCDAHDCTEVAAGRGRPESLDWLVHGQPV